MWPRLLPRWAILCLGSLHGDYIEMDKTFFQIQDSKVYCSFENVSHSSETYNLLKTCKYHYFITIVKNKTSTMCQGFQSNMVWVLHSSLTIFNENLHWNMWQKHTLCFDLLHLTLNTNSEIIAIFNDNSHPIIWVK